MRKMPWGAAIADAGLTLCCVIACINALPTAFDVQYLISLPILAAVTFALILCPLIYKAKKNWLIPCLVFAFLTALYGVLARRAIVSGANILWYSIAWPLSLDFSILPTPSKPEVVPDPSMDVTAFLVLAAAVLALIAALLVIKPKSSIPALLLPIPFFIGCFIYTDCRPAVFTAAMLVIYISGMLFGRELRKNDIRVAGVGRALFLLLLTAGAVFVALVSPQSKYEPIPFSQRRGMLDVFGSLSDSLFLGYRINPKEVDLTSNGDRQVDEDKAFSVNCSTAGSYLLRTHSYGRYTGNMWASASDYSNGWVSLKALGTTQSGQTASLLIRDAYMNERLTPYAFSAKEEISVGESFVKANGRSAYVWSFIPTLSFEPVESTPDEDAYYRYALKQYTLPNGELKEKLLGILDRLNSNEFSSHQSEGYGGLVFWAGYTIDTNQPYLTAMNIANLVRSQGTYTLTPGKSPDGIDFVEYFLTKTHRGYCVHFASATTALLQAVGIPARYVVGYRADVTKANTWIDVPRFASHAWTEVYIKGVGWIPIESSAGFPIRTGYYQGQSPTLATPEPTAAPVVTPRPIIGPSNTDDDPFNEPSHRPTARPTVKPSAPNEPAEPEKTASLTWLIPVGAVLAAACIWECVGAMIRARRKRLFNREDSRAAVLSILKYLEKLVVYGAYLPKDSQEIKYEALYSNHNMSEKRDMLLEVVRNTRETLKKHSPIERFILMWVTFRL